jgi:Putative beta-barrel porin 2
LNYVPISNFNLGIGPGLGYTHAEFGPSSFFLQAQARLNWRATDKLSFQLTGGVQETEFLGSQGGRNLFSPIYGATIQYQPFSQTQLSVYGNRSVSPSLFVGQYTETTTIGASISQRLFGQIYLSVSGSYNDQQYTASSTLVTTSRTDHFYSLTARVSHSFLERGTISVFYDYGSDDSTVAGYSYSSNQFGAEVSYAF